MRTFLYVKTNGDPMFRDKVLSILTGYAKDSKDEIYAVKENSKQEELFQENGTCKLFVFLKELKIEKLLVYSASELSLNLDDIYTFNYLLYKEGICCELVHEQLTLCDWVTEQKLVHSIDFSSL